MASEIIGQLYSVQKYRDEIDVIDITKLTDKSYWDVYGRRNALATDWNTTFPDLEQARDFIRNRAARTVEHAAKALKDAQDRLALVNASELKPKTPSRT